MLGDDKRRMRMAPSENAHKQHSLDQVCLGQNTRRQNGVDQFVLRQSFGLRCRLQVRVEVPDLRIVTDELWERVQQVNRKMKDKLYGTRVGGLNRSAQSRTYLFSGTMHCGQCDGKFAVIIGGEPSKVRYGCKNHRFRDRCSNRLTIKWRQLEEQLISAISKNLLDPRLEQQRIQDFKAQLQAAIELEEKLASESVLNGSKLKEERADLEKQSIRLADAIGQHGYSQVL